MILEGSIAIPYKWTTGRVTGRFLAELRDNCRIGGGRCKECGRVYCPPPDVCGECFSPVVDWVELCGEGTILALTNVRKQMPWSPAPPFTLALVRLDGSDTALIHLVEEGTKTGDRVRARFRHERAGSILDIECFTSGATDDYATPHRETTKENQTQMSTEPTSEVAQAIRALPARFRPGSVSQNLVFYFSIDDEKWTVRIGPESCEIEEGKTSEDADCYLKTSSEIFLATFRGEYTPSLTDFMTGTIKSNNPMLLATFKAAFSE
jgi:uncharacterized OB-fold protein